MSASSLIVSVTLTLERTPGQRSWGSPRFMSIRTANRVFSVPLYGCSLVFDVHCVIRDRLRRNFFEPVRRVRRDRNHIAFREVMRLAALRAFRANLVGSGLLGIDQSAAGNERCLAFHDNENVIRLLVDFNLAGPTALSQDSQTTFVLDDRSAFRHG